MEENVYIGPFAKRLANLREQKGVSARAMSLDLGFTHNTINSIEIQRSFPQMLNFFYICEYLGITPQEFFEYTQEYPAEDKELLAEIKNLDPKSKKYYLDMIRGTNNRPR